MFREKRESEGWRESNMWQYEDFLLCVCVLRQEGVNGQFCVAESALASFQRTLFSALAPLLGHADGGATLTHLPNYQPLFLSIPLLIFCFVFPNPTRMITMFRISLQLALLVVFFCLFFCLFLFQLFMRTHV